MFNKILIPYDGSMASEQAYALALELAERYRSAVHVLLIARPAEPATGFEVNAYLDEVRRNFKERFAKMEKRATAKELKVRFDVRLGHPAEQIVLTAQESGFDLIIIGRRGKSVVQGWPLGTVSERVLTHATCPVLAVA